MSPGQAQETLEKLEADYQRKRSEIRADKSLSWLDQERKIKSLGDRLYARRRELEGLPPLQAKK